MTENVDQLIVGLGASGPIEQLARDVASAIPVGLIAVDGYLSMYPVEVPTAGVYFHKGQVSIGLDPADARQCHEAWGGNLQKKTDKTHYVKLSSDLVSSHYDSILEAAVRAIGRRRFDLAASKPGAKVIKADAVVCPHCHMHLPATGVCDDC